MAKQHFFVRLNGPRPNFAHEMSAEERRLMGEHGIYVGGLFSRGIVLAYGPVFDPAGSFGMAIFEVEDQAEAVRCMEADPSIVAHMNTYTISPMIVGGAQSSQG